VAPYLWDTACQDVELAARWGIDDRLRADYSADLMAAGQLREGLEVYGVELSPEADQVARGHVSWHALCHLAGTWSAAMHSNLAEAAPWLLASAAQDAGRARRPLRLFGLGGQTIARRPGLYLANQAGTPRLEIHWTASNARLPLVAWRRPTDYEYLRLGLVDEHELFGIGRVEP
jgi:hypothetical protein